MKWNELGGPRLEGKEAADYACQDIYFLQHGNEHTHRVRRCITPTETIRVIRDGEPRTATSTFTQLPSSDVYCSSSMLLYVHRDHKDYKGRGAQDGHLDLHTAPRL